MPDATNPEGPLGCSTEQFSDAQLTLLCRRGFIGKRFFLDETRKVQKEAAGNFTDFNARRFNIGSAFLMKHLVEEMTPDMALVLGVAPHLPEQFTLSEGGPRRTRETFQFSPGAGWLLLDYDTDQMPDGVRQRIAELGGPLAAMEHIWPETRGACRVFKPSSSSGVYRSGDEPPVYGIGDRDVRWSYVLTDDLALCLARAATYPDPDIVNQTIDVSWSDGPHSQRDLSRIVAEVTAKPASLWIIPWWILRLAVRPARMFSELGYDLLQMFLFFRTGKFVADTSLQHRFFGPPPSARDAIARWAKRAGLIDQVQE